MSSVVVVGGGISGLSAAYFLRKANRFGRIVVLESSDRVGGWIKSRRFPDGAIYESGARSIRPYGVAGMETLKMVEDLNLAHEVIHIKRSAVSARTRLVCIKNEMHELPIGIKPIFRRTPPFSHPLLYYALRDIFVARKVKLPDDTVDNFVRRRFGDEIADVLADPLCRGVFAGDSKRLSVKTLLANLFDAEQQFGSVLRGIRRVNKKNTPQQLPVSQLGHKAENERWAIWNFSGGLQTLPEALEQRLSEEDVNFRLNCSCDGLQVGSKGVQIQVDGKDILCDHVILAIPAHKQSLILRHLHPRISSVMDTIPSVSVAVVTLEFDGNVNELLNRPAFGFLVPSTETGVKILGVIYDSCNFREHDRADLSTTRFTVMMGGAWFEELFGNFANVNPSDLLQIAEGEVRRLLGVSTPLVRQQVLVHQNCIPQYMVGHFERVKELRELVKQASLPVSFVGASFDGVGINDCIRSARNAVDELSH